MQPTETNAQLNRYRESQLYDRRCTRIRFSELEELINALKLTSPNKDLAVEASMATLKQHINNIKTSATSESKDWRYFSVLPRHRQISSDLGAATRAAKATIDSYCNASNPASDLALLADHIDTAISKFAGNR